MRQASSGPKVSPWAGLAARFRLVFLREDFLRLAPPDFLAVFLREDFLRVVFFLAEDFLRVAFLRVVFLRVVFLRAVFRLPADFLRVAFLRVVFLRVVFLRVVFLRVAFFRVVFFFAVLRRVDFLAAAMSIPPSLWFHSESRLGMLIRFCAKTSPISRRPLRKKTFRAQGNCPHTETNRSPFDYQKLPFSARFSDSQRFNTTKNRNFWSQLLLCFAKKKNAVRGKILRKQKTKKAPDIVQGSAPKKVKVKGEVSTFCWQEIGGAMGANSLYNGRGTRPCTRLGARGGLRDI